MVRNMNRRESMFREFEKYDKEKRGNRLVVRGSNRPNLSRKIKLDLLRNYKWKVIEEQRKGISI